MNNKFISLKEFAYYAFLIAFGLVFSSFPMKSRAQWSGEVKIATTNLTALSVAPKITCANFAHYKTISCIYWNYSNPTSRGNLYETISIDGGLIWSAPSLITSDAGDEYDPYIEYDSNLNRLNLVYAKWENSVGGQGNSIMFRHKSNPSGTWSSPTKVATGSQFLDYWIPSVLTLSNGIINVYFTKNGPESNFAITNSAKKTGRIMVSISNNYGFSFSAPQEITTTCDAEYARATQNSFGSILLVFSRYALNSSNTDCADEFIDGFPVSNIHQIWSNDSGATWSGESILYRSPYGSAMHPYISVETTRKQTPCANCQWTLVFQQRTQQGKWAVMNMSSQNQGASWNAPSQLSSTVWGHPIDIDGGFTIGCRGFLSFYSDAYPHQNMYAKRYDWSSSCSLN